MALGVANFACCARIYGPAESGVSGRESGVAGSALVPEQGVFVIMTHGSCGICYRFRSGSVG